MKRRQMACMCRVLSLILLITVMGLVYPGGWDLWHLGRWSPKEEASGPWDGLGGVDEVPEDEETSEDDPLSGATYRRDAAGGFDDQNSTSDGFSALPSNSSFYDNDEGGAGSTGDDESEGFAHRLLQKTMDFLSRLLSPSKTSTSTLKSNSTEVDDLQSDPGSSLCQDGDTSANCSSGSVTSDEQLPEDSVDQVLQEFEGDYPLPASTDTSTSVPTSDSPNLEPTWIDASAPCLRESIEQSAGNCNWEETKLEGALLAIFNDTIVRRLARKCVPGDWCLRKHFSKHLAQVAQRSCHLLSCLENWKDDYCRPSNVVWNSLDLLCTLTKANTSDACVISVLKMTHVTIADMIRVVVQPEDEELLCSRDEDKRDCSGPCQTAGHNLHCMSASCDNNTALFEGYAEWQWWFGMSDAVEKCQCNSSDCRLFETHAMMTSNDADMMSHHGPHLLLTFLKDNEWSVVAGLILSVLFSLLVVCGIFLGLRCSGKRRLRQRLLRQKTMVRDDGGGGLGGYRRERIQYTIINAQQDDFDDQDSDDMT